MNLFPLCAVYSDFGQWDINRMSHGEATMVVCFSLLALLVCVAVGIGVVIWCLASKRDADSP